jgi:hypothetical protein
LQSNLSFDSRFGGLAFLLTAATITSALLASAIAIVG